MSSSVRAAILNLSCLFVGVAVIAALAMESSTLFGVSGVRLSVKTDDNRRPRSQPRQTNGQHNIVPHDTINHNINIHHQRALSQSPTIDRQPVQLIQAAPVAIVLPADIGSVEGLANVEAFFTGDVMTQAQYNI